MDHLFELSTLLAAEISLPPNPIQQVGGFVSGGGVFMIFILLCSMVAVTVVLLRFLALRTAAVMPGELTYYIYRLESGRAEPEDLGRLGATALKGSSPLARIVAKAFALRGEGAEAALAGVEATAREQIVGLQRGQGVLEVVITIAPLLGLLGTVSGLISVFGVFGGADALADADPALMAAGIAEALYTTVAGLAVAVPVVIAHSYFNKKIEAMAVRMEVMLGAVVNSLQSRRVASARQQAVAEQEVVSEEAFLPSPRGSASASASAAAGRRSEPPRSGRQQQQLDLGVEPEL